MTAVNGTSLTKPPPLWPRPIPIIGVTGKYSSGKTLFGLQLDPANTLVFDMEKSSESYEALGFRRVDVPAEMMRAYPRGYKPVDTYVWWRDAVKSLAAGRYRVVILDPVSEIESGLTEWVRANPGHFGHTAAMYQKMSGIMWGDVKELWKSLLADLASRCECFVFTAHMGVVWAGDKPTNKLKPKGKDTLHELASLYLQLERNPDVKGNVPAVPSAVVLKSRQAHTSLGPDGVRIVPALPPRLPVATPAAIRAYMLKPPDYSALRPEERAPEEVLSDDERLAMRQAAAEAEAEAARLQLEAMDRKEAAASRQAGKAQAPAVGLNTTQAVAAALEAEAAAPQGDPFTDPAPTPAPEKAPTAAPARKPAQAPAPSAKATEVQLQAMAKLRKELFSRTADGATPDELAQRWAAVLARREVKTARDLTEAQADELNRVLQNELLKLDMHEGLYGEEVAPAGADGG